MREFMEQMCLFLNCQARKSNTAFNFVSSSFDFDEKDDFICSS
jgi:hypothetical protein